MTFYEARMIAQISQADLARLADMAEATIVRLENGTSPVTRKSLVRACRALGVDPDTITGVNIAPNFRPKRKRKGAQK